MRARSESPTQRHDASSSGRQGSPPRAHSTLPFYGDRSKDSSPYNAASLLRRLPKTYAVDYSYHAFTSVAALSGEAPRSGVVFVRKEQMQAQSPSPAAKSGQHQLGDAIKQQQQKANEMQSMLFQFGDVKRQQGKTQVTDDGVVVIKAKDENYAFKEMDQAVYTSDKDMKNWVMDANGNLVRRKLTPQEEQALLEAKRVLYRCSTLKLNNNSLTDLNHLDRALYLTLYKPTEHLSVLDMSCNQIAYIPKDFAARYPIHTLLLHGNRIGALEEVRKLAVLSPTLRTLTLYDNPIQHALKRKYRMTVLCLLPFVTSLDDVRVTEADRSKLGTFVDMFVPRKNRGAMLYSINHNGDTTGAGGLLPPIGRR